jgi:hypothetical protein
MLIQTVLNQEADLFIALIVILAFAVGLLGMVGLLLAVQTAARTWRGSYKPSKRT